MKLGNLALSLIALTVTTSSFAGILSGSSNINFLAFDGHKVKKSSTLHINDTNTHQAVLEVSGIYRVGSDDTFFESQPIIVTFNGSTEDIQIIAPDLRSEYDVSNFKASPSFKIQTASGKTLSYKADYLKGEGFMPNANIIENLANYNAGNGVAAVKSLAATSIGTIVPTANHKTAKGKVMVQGENIAEQQLQYWFQQADKETQKRFLDWAKKQ